MTSLASSFLSKKGGWGGLSNSVELISVNTRRQGELLGEWVGSGL